MWLQKLSSGGSGKSKECRQIHICLSIFSNLKTTSRLGYLVLHKYTWNIDKFINLSQRKGGSSIEPMIFWHMKKLWGKFEFQRKSGKFKIDLNRVNPKKVQLQGS